MNGYIYPGSTYAPQYSYPSTQLQMPVSQPMTYVGNAQVYDPTEAALGMDLDGDGVIGTRSVPTYAVPTSTYVTPTYTTPTVAAPVQPIITYQPQQPMLQKFTVQKNVQVPKTMVVSPATDARTL